MIVYQRAQSAQFAGQPGAFGVAFRGFGEFVSTTAFVTFGTVRGLASTIRSRSVSTLVRARSLADVIRAKRMEPDR